MPEKANKAAVSYAERGWFVFPVQPNKKVPYKGFAWKEKSTNDPETVKQVIDHPKYKSCNWALDCGRSNVFVVDIDIQKDGVKSLADLPEQLISEFVVQTPKGGFHYYYSGAGPNTVEKLAPGIDTRGTGGYVLIPGSENKDGQYEFVREKDLQPLPEFVASSLGPPPAERREDADIPLSDPDQPHNISQALSYLKTQAPEAVEGSGGDQNTYLVACRLRDLGLSPEKAVEMMSEHWNETKAQPPWDIEQLQTKVNNAFRYGKDRPGNATIEAMFPPERQSTSAIRCAADVEIKDLVPRAWLLGYRYLPEYITLTIAPGGVGKSLLTIVEGMSIASGKSLTRDTVHQPGAVWLYNTEDPFDELDRRVMAAARYHQLTKQDLSKFFYSSGYDNPLKLGAPDDRGRPVINEQLVEAIVAQIASRSIKLFIVDPFIECHSFNENDNTAIAAVAQTFRRIAKRTGCAISLVHHTSKGKQERGNMDKSRGASALVSAARIAHTLYPMTPKEGSDFGVKPGRENWYVRLDDAKANLSPPTGVSCWYEKHSVRLMFDSEETTGTLAPVQFAKKELNISEALVPIYKLPFDGETKSISLNRAAEHMRKEGVTGNGGGAHATNVRRGIESLFSLIGGETPVGPDGFRVRLTVRGNIKTLVKECIT